MIKKNVLTLLLTSIGLFNFLGCGNGNEISGGNSELHSTPATASDGFISLRLDLGEIARGTAGEYNIIAVVTGTNFYQRKQNLVRTDSREQAFLDWPYLSANNVYTVNACFDKNNDGICNEKSYARVIRPVKGLADQTVRILWNTLSASEAAQNELQRFGAMPKTISYRVTTSPSYDWNSKSSPWYAGSGPLSLSFAIDANSKFSSTSPVASDKVVLKSGTASRINFKGLEGQFFGGFGYDLKVSTCGFKKSSCTVLTHSETPYVKDFDIAIPAVQYP
ncbi:MAG: hypothetical protein EOP10_11365 [Proteobacteria bacterium]|nr:MAG: hypothetical protein EOP10_11365 [Pseudomonadota bacterium]